MFKGVLDRIGRLVDRLWVTEDRAEHDARIEAEEADLDPATREARAKVRVMTEEKRGSGTGR